MRVASYDHVRLLTRALKLSKLICFNWIMMSFSLKKQTIKLLLISSVSFNDIKNLTPWYNFNKIFSQNEWYSLSFYSILFFKMTKEKIILNNVKDLAWFLCSCIDVECCLEDCTDVLPLWCMYIVYVVFIMFTVPSIKFIFILLP